MTVVDKSYEFHDGNKFRLTNFCTNKMAINYNVQGGRRSIFTPNTFGSLLTTVPAANRNVVKEMIESDIKIDGLVQDIRSNCQSVDDMNKVNQKIKEQMKTTQTRLNYLERIANEQDKETDRLWILEDVEIFRQQLSRTQISIRKANLSCKMAIDRSERESLLQGSTDPDLRKRLNKENLAKTATSITDNLMSLNRMMAANVAQSGLSNQVLVKSSATISDTHEEFKGMGGVIQTSRSLLTKYNRRELTDRLLIFLAVALFLATVLYILKKRIF